MTQLRRPIPVSIKDEVLLRQNYKCAKCKKSIGELGVKPQFHHIKQVKEGSNEPENLRALCLNCHGQITHHQHLAKAIEKERGHVALISEAKNQKQVKVPKINVSTGDMYKLLKEADTSTLREILRALIKKTTYLLDTRDPDEMNKKKIITSIMEDVDENKKHIKIIAEYLKG